MFGNVSGAGTDFAMITFEECIKDLIRSVDGTLLMVTRFSLRQRGQALPVSTVTKKVE